MTSFEKRSTITVCLGYARCAYYDALLPLRARRMVIMICKRTMAISRSTPCLTQRCTRRQSVRGSPRSSAGCVCACSIVSPQRLPSKSREYEACLVHFLVVVAAQLLFFFQAPSAQRLLDVALRIFTAHHEADAPARVCIVSVMAINKRTGLEEDLQVGMLV